MKDYAILVNSCDSYEDAWPFFFFLLKKNWRGKLPLIYLNTETKKYIDNSIRVISINSDKSLPWGSRLKHCLAHIDNDFILMMLEDFYYEAPINIDVVNKCVEYMKENTNILSFQFVPCGEVVTGYFPDAETDFPGFVKRKKFAQFLIAAVPTLWRKKDLMTLTMDGDNPWEWEFFGSFRTWFYNMDVYCWNMNDLYVFKYDVVHGGAIHRGKWVGYKIEELSHKYNIMFDYGMRAIEYDWMKQIEDNKKVPVYKRLGSILRNRSRMAGEIFRGIWLRLN